MPYAAFSGPIPSVNLTMIAYPGSARNFGPASGQRSDTRIHPDFPVLQFNEAQSLFFGGNFWDGRSTGYLLQSPDAEQAQHPPVDTQEHGLPDTACIAFRLSQAVYRPLFELVWGAGSLDIKFPPNTEKICATPGGASRSFGRNTTPIQLSPADRTKANRVYDNWGQSISAYEASPDISAFSSKFDAFLAGNYTLTADEHGRLRPVPAARPAAIHATSTAEGALRRLDRLGPHDDGTDTSAAADVTPLFTCFGYANLGLPLNPRDAIYYQTTPDPFGFTPNPFGFALQRFGIGHLPQKRPRLRPQSERRIGHHWRRVSTAKCRWRRRAMWP